MQNTQISSHFSADSTLLETTRPLHIRISEVPLMQGAPGESGAFLLTAAHTAGRTTLADAIVGVNGGPPPHIHANEEEIFVIQSGAFELLVNGELVEARAGDVAYMARGEAHRFRGLDIGEPNRCFVVAAPSGFEEFMGRWVPLFKNGAPDMQDAVRLCAEYGITLFPSDDMAPPPPADARSKVVRANKQPLSVAGTNVTVLLDSVETEGRYSLIRVEGPRDSGPPLHWHEREDELFMIEAGQIEITIDEGSFIAEAGDVVWAPRGHNHTFRIASERACMSVFMTPGGFEDYFIEADQMEITGGVDLSALIALNERFGIKPA